MEAESRKLNFIYDPEGAVQFCSITDANVHKRMASQVTLCADTAWCQQQGARDPHEVVQSNAKEQHQKDRGDSAVTAQWDT